MSSAWHRVSPGRRHSRRDQVSPGMAHGHASVQTTPPSTGFTMEKQRRPALFQPRPTPQAIRDSAAPDVVDELCEGRGIAVDDVAEPAGAAVAASDQRFGGSVSVPELSRIVKKEHRVGQTVQYSAAPLAGAGVKLHSHLIYQNVFQYYNIISYFHIDVRGRAIGWRAASRARHICRCPIYMNRPACDK